MQEPGRAQRVRDDELQSARLDSPHRCSEMEIARRMNRSPTQDDLEGDTYAARKLLGLDNAKQQTYIQQPLLNIYKDDDLQSNLSFFSRVVEDIKIY